MSKRLTRKELKEDIRHDEFQEAVATTYDEIRSHAKAITIAGIAIVVIALGYAGTRMYLNKQNESGSEALADAMRVFHAPIVEEDAKPDDKRAPSFASTDERTTRARDAMAGVSGGVAGDVASLYTASLEAQAGDKDAARARWEEVLKSQKGNALAIAAERNIIRYDRENGRGEELVDRLKSQLGAQDKNLPEEIILFELAETLDELGQSEEAKDYYQQLLDDYPKSPFGTRAREKTS